VVKVFDHESLDRGKERFQRFTRMLARLNHPGIPRYIGAVADPPAIACEYTKGTFLNEQLVHGPLDPRATLSLARELSATLSYLHSEGIVHRAVKPEAVFITEEGQAQLMDFGVALESEEERLTQAGAVVGTLRILPPEAFESGQEGPAFDLYALGVLLHEALTGVKAFGNADGSKVSTSQLLTRKMTTEFLDPGEDAPQALRELVQDLTRMDTNERLSDAMKVVVRLQGVKIRSAKAGSAGSDLLANLQAARSQAAPEQPAPVLPVPEAAAPSPVAAPQPVLAPRTSPAVVAPPAEPAPAAPIGRSLIIAIAAVVLLAAVAAGAFFAMRG
jgi:serine/threonine protein kinase